METMQPTLKRGRDVWDRVNMPKAEFLGRVEETKERMKQQGIDVFLLYSNSGNEYANSCYTTNYIMKMPQGAIVAVTKTGEVALIYEGFARDVPGVKAVTWVEDVRSCDDVSRQTVAFLSEKGLIPSTIGLAGLEQSMPHDQYRFFLKSTEGCTLVPADEMIREMRVIKSQRELDQVRRAARLVSFIFGELARPAFPVASEKALEAVMARQAFLEGAEDVRVLIARPGEEACALRPAKILPYQSATRSSSTSLSSSTGIGLKGLGHLSTRTAYSLNQAQNLSHLSAIGPFGPSPWARRFPGSAMK